MSGAYVSYKADVEVEPLPFPHTLTKLQSHVRPVRRKHNLYILTKLRKPTFWSRPQWARLFLSAEDQCECTAVRALVSEETASLVHWSPARISAQRWTSSKDIITSKKLDPWWQFVTLCYLLCSLQGRAKGSFLFTSVIVNEVLIQTKSRKKHESDSQLMQFGTTSAQDGVLWYDKESILTTIFSLPLIAKLLFLRKLSM